MLFLAALPLLLGYDKTMSKTLFYHWFPGCHPLMLRQSHPLANRVYTWEIAKKIHRSRSFILPVSFVLCMPQKDSACCNQKRSKLMNVYSLQNYYMSVSTSGQPAGVAPIIGGCWLLYYHLLANFFLRKNVHFCLHTHRESSSGIIKYTLLDCVVL